MNGYKFVSNNPALQGFAICTVTSVIVFMISGFFIPDMLTKVFITGVTWAVTLVAYRSIQIGNYQSNRSFNRDRIKSAVSAYVPDSAEVTEEVKSMFAIINGEYVKNPNGKTKKKILNEKGQGIKRTVYRSYDRNVDYDIDPEMVMLEDENGNPVRPENVLFQSKGFRDDYEEDRIKNSVLDNLKDENWHSVIMLQNMTIPGIAVAETKWLEFMYLLSKAYKNATAKADDKMFKEPAVLFSLEQGQKASLALILSSGQFKVWSSGFNAEWKDYDFDTAIKDLKNL